MLLWYFYKGYYRVLLISKDVVVNSNDSLKTFGVLIKVQLQVKGLSIHKWVTIVKDLNFLPMQLSGLACPGQKLMIHTYPQSNMSDIMDHAKLIIESSGDVVYPIAIGIKGKQLYAAIVNVIGIEGLVDTLNMTFSEFVLSQ